MGGSQETMGTVLIDFCCYRNHGVGRQWGRFSLTSVVIGIIRIIMYGDISILF